MSLLLWLRLHVFGVASTPTQPSAFVLVDAHDRFTLVDSADRFFLVPGEARFTPVGEE